MSGINALVRKLEKLGAAQVKERVAEKVAVSCFNETMKCFNQKRDPYGIPWAPRKKRPVWAALAFGPDTGWPLLNYTGKGIASIRATSVGPVVRVRILGRMEYHQTGTRKMVARKFFPEDGKGLGTWKPAIEAASLSAIRELMKGE